MRREVLAAPMAHFRKSDESQSLQSASYEQQPVERRIDVGQSARQFGCLASSTVQNLYIIVRVGLARPGMQTLAELAQKIYPLTAVLSGLREGLIQSESRGCEPKSILKGSCAQ